MNPDLAADLFDLAITKIEAPVNRDLRPAFVALDRIRVMQREHPDRFPPDAAERLAEIREGADDRPLVVLHDLLELRDQCRAAWKVEDWGNWRWDR